MPTYRTALSTPASSPISQGTNIAIARQIKVFSGQIQRRMRRKTYRLTPPSSTVAVCAVSSQSRVISQEACTPGLYTLAFEAFEDPLIDRSADTAHRRGPSELATGP